MAMPLQEVASKALSLSPPERAELAHELILSLGEVTDKEVEKAWDAEIERRVAEIKSGKAKGRPAEDILAEIRARYAWSASKRPAHRGSCATMSTKVGEG